MSSLRPCELSSSSGVVLALTLVAAGPGCTTERVDSCATPGEGLPVRIVGQAYGYGTIATTWDPSTERHRVAASWLGPDGTPRIELEGDGICESGILRVRFDGGLDEGSELRVLGGGLLVAFKHEPMPEVVGLWDIRVVQDARDPAPRRVRGMFEQVGEDEVLRDDKPVARATGGAD